MTKQSKTRHLLTFEMKTFWLSVHDTEIKEALSAFKTWQKGSDKQLNQSDDNLRRHQLCHFIIHDIANKSQQIESLHERFTLFTNQIQRSSSEEELWQHQMTFLEFMSYSKRHIQKDRKAKKRWFGNDAIKDRYQEKVAKLEHSLCFLLQRLGHLIDAFAQYSTPIDTQSLLKSLSLEEQLSTLLYYESDERLAFEAMGCLRVAFDHLNLGIINQLDPKLIQHAYSLASDPHKPIWVQTEAMALLLSFGQESAVTLLIHRLKKPSKLNDDLFFRARCIHIIFTYTDNFSQAEIESLVALILKDPSIYVRQQLCEQLSNLHEPIRLNTFLQIINNDKETAVQAKAWLTLPQLINSPLPANFSTNDSANQANIDPPETQFKDLSIILQPYLNEYLSALKLENNTWVLRLLIELAPKIFNSIQDNLEQEKNAFYTFCQKILTETHTTHQETRMRRWAAMAREQLWSCQQSNIHVGDLHALTELSLEDSIKISKPDIPEQDLGRILATLSHQGVGFDISTKKHKLNIRGGYTLKFRLWRFLHEWRHPSTDKRQNHNHIQGRYFFGKFQIPPQHLAESSETKVPGEPVLIDQENGWRPYLPLVDQILSSLDQGWPTQPVKLYTSEGITSICPPSNIFKRLWAKLYISYHFKRFSDLRNWQDKSELPAQQYLQAFTDLGFQFNLNTYIEKNKSLPTDERVNQFFPALLPFYSLPEFFREIQNYFYSVYQNTLEQLSIFLVAISAIFFGQHFFLNQQFRKARKAIPFVIGGWGTRGKSGTERLKAALFNAQGISLISKTTGCEAQFLYAPPNRPLKELFLFRPYDKASIWEQLHLTRLAAKLKVNILLWECMGLTPRYINILQQQWMRDDLATITNCYPDHEDIQGPSGIDIPKVMMRFVPRNSTLITSEDTMSPLLESAARDNNSDCYKISWHQGHFLAPDILKRFPYEEHPTNIALVLKMADILGFPQDMAIKSMADNVVPDLGVLKVYPVCLIKGRQFNLINGFSANERLAALNNWHRLNLHNITPESEPNIWLTTVVNNRADRIARSQVFAKILANDLSADQHFLIGSNVDGLLKYIQSEWQFRTEQIPLSPNNDQQWENLLEKWLNICQYLRLPQSEETIQSRIRAMLIGLSINEADKLSLLFNEPSELETSLKQLEVQDFQAILEYCENAKIELQTFKQFHQGILNKQPINAEALRSQLWQWFRSRLIIIDHQHASGNELIQNMINNTPPGLHNKMMGLQNIKGTGLDFIYRWQSWDNTYKLCEALNGRQTSEAKKAAKELSNINDFGLLDQEWVNKTCQQVRDKKMAQTEFFQAELNTIESHVKQQLKEVRMSLGLQNTSNIIDKIISAFEAFLDAGQSIKRRKKAEKIYHDLADQRISLERAGVELQKINKDQKGGWLSVKIKRNISDNNISN